MSRRHETGSTLKFSDKKRRREVNLLNLLVSSKLESSVRLIPIDLHRRRNEFDRKFGTFLRTFLSFLSLIFHIKTEVGSGDFIRDLHPSKVEILIKFSSHLWGKGKGFAFKGLPLNDVTLRRVEEIPVLRVT